MWPTFRNPLSFPPVATDLPSVKGTGVKGSDVKGTGVKGLDVKGTGVKGLDVKGLDVQGTGFSPYDYGLGITGL